MTFVSPPDRPEKSALAPDLRRLTERGVRAWTEAMAVRPLADGGYAVDSESGANYVVDLADGSCTCPDHQLREERCKHLRRVAVEVTAQRVPPPGKTWATCDACGMDTFVDRDADPPHLCGNCGLAPGDVVRDRETGDRLVVERVLDRRADEVDIPAAATTVADYPTNGGYPDDELVVEGTYPAERARREDPRVYSFPHSRLRRVDDAAIID